MSLYRLIAMQMQLLPYNRINVTVGIMTGEVIYLCGYNLQLCTYLNFFINDTFCKISVKQNNSKREPFYF